MAGSIGQFVNNSAHQAIQGVMGHEANAVSAQAQANQGAFNQASADLANSIDSGRLTAQYGFNSAMMQDANQYNAQMWQKAADWNEAMWERQAQFNAEQAQIQRDWSERMENTRYQRAIKDMSAAGLNPILAVTNGGLSTGSGSGAAATVGGAQMSSASAQMASGGLLGASSASEGLYGGQLEFTGGLLNLLSTMMNGISSAATAAAPLGKQGDDFLDTLCNTLFKDSSFAQTWNDNRKNNKGKSRSERTSVWDKLGITKNGSIFGN